MPYKTTTYTLLMIMALALTLWMTLFIFKRQSVEKKQYSGLPDAYMETVTAQIMDKSGKLKLKIETPKMIHYREGDISQLITPTVTIYRDSPSPWYIQSKYAKAYFGIERVDFWDNVVIRHPQDLTNPTTLIKTSFLTVQPNKQIAKTSEVIELIQPNFIVRSAGMYADMESGDVHLLSQARGEYVPD